jgi:hypothetical protein
MYRDPYLISNGLRARWWCAFSAVLVMAVANPGPALAEEGLNGLPACQAESAGKALFITETCVDPDLAQPYVDVKRPGTITDAKTGVTVNFLYVHGGFKGTDTRFSFYFPDKDKYQGRFFQTTYPTLSQEDAAAGCPAVGTSDCSVAFALAEGAYVVSSNNAGGVPVGGALAPYRANAAAAKYSRVVAAEVYGTADRPRGYIYGASGGGYQAVGSMENTSGVWDGAVPMVFGVPNAIPNFMTVQLLALRVLKDTLPQIADAMAPGGSGDPYAGLNAQERSVLQEVTRLGMPLRGWWQYATLNGGGFWAVAGAVRAIDSTYNDDFWSKPGYEGSTPAVQAARIRHDTKVASLAGNTDLVLANIPAGDLVNADLLITSGPKAGQSLHIMGVTGNTVKVADNSGITPDTGVKLDNSWLLALQYYQRHQVPPGNQYGWNQYLDEKGAPRYPQRPVLVGPILNASSAGSVANGQFNGKMIMVASVMDVMAFPWSADWYYQQVQSAGASNLSANFRVWFMDNADHGPELSEYEAGVGFAGVPGAANHIVGYIGEVQQALLDLDAWVANGVLPPASTGYHIDEDNQVILAATAGQRFGVQPVVTLTARGKPGSAASQSVEVEAGGPVAFSLHAEAPPGTGKIVKVEWDFEGQGSYTANAPLDRVESTLNLAQEYTFSKPGTYFPVVRVTSQREGDTSAPFRLVQNLASVRVLVR